MPPATFRAAQHSSQSSNLQGPPSALPAAPPPPAVPAAAPPSPAPSRSSPTSSPRYRLPAAPPPELHIGSIWSLIGLW